MFIFEYMMLVVAVSTMTLFSFSIEAGKSSSTVTYCTNQDGEYNSCSHCQKIENGVFALGCILVPGELKKGEKFNETRVVERRSLSEEGTKQKCDWYLAETDQNGKPVTNGKICEQKPSSRTLRFRKAHVLFLSHLKKVCHQTTQTFKEYSCKELATETVCTGCSQPVVIASVNS
ncbi:hypothetical protein O181_062168 [Austropuccinia psidii MF-1]|uniref:Secreted protein n=1 Tax=Austropuccinia psidii MF-1 TaxID=1389203 RepID=A0A9Q3EJ97_9BASI|nr:hypothetical protein [Austropuccinia psidii MF-1]